MSRLQMDPATLARLSQLLDEGLERPSTERDAWIESLDAQLDSLKPRLRDLLSRAALVETGEFLNTLPRIDVIEPATSPDLAVGQVVGTYRLVRELGVGGMGSVWLAERTDGLVQRPVALKLPHVMSYRRAELVERMAREREILATLDHRNIARLLDAGVDVRGQPWLAIDYVEGEPIDRYCAAVPVLGRITLFLEVARAVAYAHGKLVLHRDLKPANILVTSGGDVRLLDFGIAKLLAPGAAQDSALTRFGGGAFTPDYASPEQVRGEPLTVASDVYSLGVVLYELLAGARPYKLQRDSRGALEEAILLAEPRPPSEMAPSGKALKGDLDIIVLKALKKQPAERYATVDALADDLVRHLERRPVLARPDGAGYRLRRFVARNQLGVGAAVAVILAILGGAGVAVWQARVARAESRRAEEVQRLMVSIFSNANPNQGSGEKISATDLLRQAQVQLAGTRIDDDRIRLELLNSLGQSMLGLNDSEGAAPVLDAAVHLADSFDPLDPVVLRAHLLHAEVDATLGRKPVLANELADALQSMRLDPPRYGHVYVSGLVTQARIQMSDGHAEEAAQVAGEALAQSRVLIGPRSPEAVAAYETLANANDHLGKSDAAFKAASDGFGMARELFSNEDHPLFNNMRRQYAVALVDRDRVSEGLELMEQSRQASARLYGESSRITAIYAGSMVRQLLMDGRVAQALELSERSYGVLAPLYVTNESSLAEISSMRGNALMNARRAAEALPFTERALTFLVREVGPESEFAFTHTMQHGRELALLGRLDEARRDLEWVAKGYQSKGHGGMSVPLYQLGFLRRIAGRAAEAEALQTRALAAIPAGPGARRASARILVELGLAERAAGHESAARAHLGDALTIYSEKFSEVSPERADALIGMAQIELGARAPARAFEFAAQADRYWQSLDVNSRSAGEAAWWLAASLESLGRKEEAEAARVRARRALAGSRFPGDAELFARLDKSGA